MDAKFWNGLYEESYSREVEALHVLFGRKDVYTDRDAVMAALALVHICNAFQVMHPEIWEITKECIAMKAGEADE